MTEQEWGIAIVDAWHEVATTEPRRLYVEWLARNQQRQVEQKDRRSPDGMPELPEDPVKVRKMAGRLIAHRDVRPGDPIFVIAQPWATVDPRPGSSRRFCAACMVPVATSPRSRELLGKENARLVCHFCYRVTADVLKRLTVVRDNLLTSREGGSGTEAVQ